MDRKLAITKVKAYAKRPDIIKEPSMGEMADLVVLVLTAVEQIENAIKEHRLDGKTPEPDKDYLSKETALRMISEAVNDMLATTDATLSETSSALQARVETALQNIRDGKDGIITDAEIARAAEMAAALIERPDFEGMLNGAVQANGILIRDALESIPEGDDQLRIEAIQGLRKELDDLKGYVGKNIMVGGLTRGGVLQLIAESGSSLPDQTGNSGKFLTTNGTTASWGTPPGSSSGITRTVTVTSGSATAGSTAATDYVYMIAGAHTMSLPAASGNTNRYTFKNNHSANVTIDTVGVETIEGAASISLAPEEAVDIISDGTNFRII